MANRHTKVSANKAGEVAVSSTTTDAPILPIDQIERLQAVAPGRVDWVFEQTELEAEHRRDENRRVNTMVFVERLTSLLFALLIAVLGMASAVYLALNDRQVTAAVIGGATLTSMVASFLLRGRSGRAGP